MRVYIEKNVLSNIASAIRKRGNTTERLYPSDMPRAIKQIPHDIECFRQETDGISACLVPTIDAGTLVHQHLIPAIKVMNGET